MSHLEAHLAAAEIYLGSGAPRDALNELARLTASEQSTTGAVCMRLRILTALQWWGSLAIVARNALRKFPGSGELYLLSAQGARSAGRVEEARAWLLAGEGMLSGNGQWHLELARCESLLGNDSAARERLSLALGLDGSLREQASRDAACLGALQGTESRQGE